MDKYEGEVALLDKDTVIYFIEGYGSDLSVNGRSSAMCVVVKNGKVVFASENSATLPDQPFNPNTNLDKNGNPRDVPNVIDGVYKAVNKTHKTYPGLNVVKPSVIRINKNGIVRHDTSDGINIHKKNRNTCTVYGENWANSAGCFLVGKANDLNEYKRFAHIVGFAYEDKAKVGYGIVKDGAKSKPVSCCVVVDRAYAYEHLKTFRNYMIEKYTDSNGITYPDAINGIIRDCYHPDMQDGLCPSCGYYDKRIITPYPDLRFGNVAEKSDVYVNTQKKKDGSQVFNTDRFLVLGEYGDFYLIKYTLTSSGFKTRFIEKEKVKM